MRERSRLERTLGDFERLQQEFEDSLELIELGEAEGDEAVILEVETSLQKMQERTSKLEIESLLSDEADDSDCFLEVNAGAGGTEAQDWAEMLLRMYSRWAEQRGFEVTLLDEHAGEEAGIKSATLEIKGENAYGWSKTEAGVHRLVRISPYDSSARRHTSFAAVSISPQVDDAIEIEILDKDLKMDTYRASGAGGQHVNRTDSAVRLTHIPSGIVVACQQDRSQHRNRDTAMKMLRSRIYELELKKREEAAQAVEGEKSEIGWGHQIRSYVLHPYQMVKDQRTGVESGDTQKILDGAIDPFLNAALAARIKGQGEG